MRNLLLSLAGLLAGFIGVLLCMGAAQPAVQQCTGCVNTFCTTFHGPGMGPDNCKLQLQMIADPNGCGTMSFDSDGVCAGTVPDCDDTTNCKYRKLLQYSSCCDDNELCWNCGNQNCCAAPQTTTNCNFLVWQTLLCIQGLVCLSGEADCDEELACVATLTNDTAFPQREEVSLDFVRKCSACQ
jgi:hypothetical protein